MVWHTDFGAQQSNLICLPSLHGRERCSFKGFILPSDTVKSRSDVGINPGDSLVVIEFKFIYLV